MCLHDQTLSAFKKRSMFQAGTLLLSWNQLLSVFACSAAISTRLGSFSNTIDLVSFLFAHLFFSTKGILEKLLFDEIYEFLTIRQALLWFIARAFSSKTGKQDCWRNFTKERLFMDLPLPVSYGTFYFNVVHEIIHRIGLSVESRESSSMSPYISLLSLE